MFSIVLENPDTHSVEKYLDREDLTTARGVVAMLKRQGYKAVWIINTRTGEIL